jgi:pimeloyl-ACP methyl ester carboxylesterase
LQHIFFPMRHFLLVLLSFVFSASVFAQFDVGSRSITLTDAARANRSIPCQVYYPANTAGNNVPVAAGVFPLLIFGHGFLMSTDAYDVVWEALVPSGYIMVLPTTESGISPSHTEFAKDLAFIEEELRTSSSQPFFNYVADYSAVMGHSMGGGSAFLAVQYNENIDALVTFAAAETNPSAIAASGDITLPSLVISGANDCITPPNQHQVPMYDALASTCKMLVTIDGASHCQFAGESTQCDLGEFFCSLAPVISEPDQQSRTHFITLNWLNYFLKGQCESGEALTQSIASDPMVGSNQNCVLGCTNAVSEAENVSFSFQAAPQPMSDSGQLYFSKEVENATVRVYDAQGKLVLEEHGISSSSFRFDVSAWPMGVYQCVVQAKGISAQSISLLIAR